MALGIGYRIKKLLIAAGRAAKGKGQLPPQLWKIQHTSPPTWAEFDEMSYREIVTIAALENVYNVVRLWKSGKFDAEVSKVYARLVADGIVGKNI